MLFVVMAATREGLDTYSYYATLCGVIYNIAHYNIIMSMAVVTSATVCGVLPLLLLIITMGIICPVC